MEVADWWLAQMRALLPGIANRPGRQRDALLVVIDRFADSPTGPLAGSLRLRQGGLESPAGVLDLARPRPATLPPHLPTGLRLPPGAVLERDIVLPLAAAHSLQTVIGFEIDRLTPFEPHEVFWGIAAQQPDRERGKLGLRLLVVLRAQAEAALQALAPLQLAPSFIETESGRIELAAMQPRANRYLQAGLAGLCGMLALACIVTPFQRQQAALDAAARSIAASAPAAHTASALRQQLAIAASGRTAIAQARRAGDALQVLATLTTALPDGTWLSDLALKSGDLTIDGQSTDAARLIGLLSAVPELRNPNFTAPVTRTADGRADQFSLHAGVAE